MAKFLVKNKLELEEYVAKRIAEIIKEKENPFFIMATGNSPVGVYKNLIKIHQKGLSFKKLTTYNLDEYKDIGKFKKDSFRKFMNDNLFDHIDIDKSNTHFPEEPEAYDIELDKVGKFDFAILGVGTNGHIAFNEPGTDFFTRTNITNLTDSTIKSNFPGREEYPTRAITMGLFDIYNKSKEIVLLAWGESKKDALSKLKEGIKRDDYPITHFVDHPKITILTDLKEFE